jgi:IS30 family transposase
LRQEVEKLISKYWPPEIVSGRLKKRRDLPSISAESIYRWIFSDKPHLIGYLARYGKGGKDYERGRRRKRVERIKKSG